MNCYMKVNYFAILITFILSYGLSQYSQREDKKVGQSGMKSFVILVRSYFTGQ